MTFGHPQQVPQIQLAYDNCVFFLSSKSLYLRNGEIYKTVNYYIPNRMPFTEPHGSHQGCLKLSIDNLQIYHMIELFQP